MGNICRLLKHYSLTTETVDKWKLTLCEIVEKNMKRTPEEVLLACSLASLICVQLGPELEESIGGSLSALRTALADPTASEAVRAASAHAIGICVCLSSVYKSDSSEEILRQLKSIWFGMKPGSGDVACDLFSSALSSWALLLRGFSTRLVASSIEECAPKLCVFLRSPSVEVRISAGEALAVLQEIGISRVDENFAFDNIDELEDLLSGLAADSNKHRGVVEGWGTRFS